MVGPARIFKYTPALRAMLPDLQRYQLNLIKKCGRICRFSESKSVYFFEFLRCFTFAENPKMKVNSLKNKNIDI